MLKIIRDFSVLQLITKKLKTIYRFVTRPSREIFFPIYYFFSKSLAYSTRKIDNAETHRWREIKKAIHRRYPCAVKCGEILLLWVWGGPRNIFVPFFFAKLNFTNSLLTLLKLFSPKITSSIYLYPSLDLVFKMKRQKAIRKLQRSGLKNTYLRAINIPRAYKKSFIFSFSIP